MPRRSDRRRLIAGYSLAGVLLMAVMAGRLDRGLAYLLPVVMALGAVAISQPPRALVRRIDYWLIVIAYLACGFLVVFFVRQ